MGLKPVRMGQAGARLVHWLSLKVGHALRLRALFVIAIRGVGTNQPSSRKGILK